MDVVDFENARWAERPIGLQRWHIQAAELVQSEPVLDIGGGDGIFATTLKERGLTQVTVTDISDVAIETARARGLDAQVIDVRHVPLPYDDASFGTVTLLNLLEHIYNPVALLRECARIAESVVIVVPNFHYWKYRLSMLKGKIPFESKPHRGHIHWFNEHLLRDVLEQAGLEAEEWKYMTALMGVPAIWSALGKARPMLFASGYAVRCRPVLRATEQTNQTAQEAIAR